MTAPIDTMPKLGSSSSSSSSNRASARARALPAALSGASSAEAMRRADADAAASPRMAIAARAPAEGDRRPWRGRKESARKRQDGVAHDPAETGRQRPASRRRKEGSERRRGDHAAEIEADFQARPLESSRGDEAPAPESRGHEQGRDEARPTNLHHEVGGDRAGRAEKIVDARVGRVIEARIADRPGQQRERRGWPRPRARARPAISAARRFGNSRTEAGRWSKTENVVVRIGSLAGSKQRLRASPSLTLSRVKLMRA